MSTTHVSIQMLKQAAEVGLTLPEAAEEFDVSYSALKEKARRAGVSFTKCHQRKMVELKRVVQDMKPLDAVDYLLGAVESLIEVTGVNQDRQFGMTASEARIFNTLKANGQLSKEQMLEALIFDRRSEDEIPDIKVVDVFISKIRRKLPAEAGHIVTIWGEGYRFVPPQGEDA